MSAGNVNGKKRVWTMRLFGLFKVQRPRGWGQGKKEMDRGCRGGGKNEASTQGEWNFRIGSSGMAGKLKGF